MSVIQLPTADPKVTRLADALLDVLYEHGEGMSLPTIVGVLELLKFQVMEDQDE